MQTLIRPAFVSFVILSLITGGLYPALVTGGAQALFPSQANGSLMTDDGSRMTGTPSSVIRHPSSLIGQPFTKPGYFWSRPSATGPVAYNAAASSGSNLGPNNPAQAKAIAERTAALQAADSGNPSPVPLDLVMASGSGLDPHISPAAAEYQVGRVARARGLSVDSVRVLIAAATSGPQFGILGDPVVNVVRLNRALDAVTATP